MNKKQTCLSCGLKGCREFKKGWIEGYRSDIILTETLENDLASEDRCFESGFWAGYNDKDAEIEHLFSSKYE